MMFSDYICDLDKKGCGSIFEVHKNNIDEKWPINPKCPNCGKKVSYRKYGCSGYSVAEGLMGNYKNGYTKNIVYHSSSLTGKLKGKLVR